MSSEETNRLYADYRGEDYFSERNSFEPWYTRAINDAIGSEGEMMRRRKVLLQVLDSCGISPGDITYAIDYGGDRGQMLADFSHAKKCVFDLSGIAPDAGVERLDCLEAGYHLADLVLNCHVLEHMTDPRKGLKECIELARPGGLIFVEVPDEIWKGQLQPWFQEGLLKYLCARPSVLKWVDFLCTAVRVKLGWIPPLMFLAIREHINYFTLDSIARLMRCNGIEILSCQKSSLGHLTLLGRKGASDLS